ncbi:MAG: hypothetical protein ABI740_06205 [Alphaproteobacteria bacterium]
MIGRHRLAVACLTALLVCACAPKPTAIVYDGRAFHVEHWKGSAPRAGGWPAALVIRAGDDPTAPQLIGDYKVINNRLTFTPRFPPSDGVKLHAVFHPGNGRPDVVADFGSDPKTIIPSTTVAHLYPSAQTWPANTLKFYLTFSAPMARGEAYTHIHIRDAEGKLVEKPFVEIDQELWDPSSTRLTVLFDPGRIKRGLVDNEHSGPPLVEDRRVTLEVDPGWRDARGAPLAEGFGRVIDVSAAVRTPVAVKDWRIDAPPSPGADLVVTFPRPMDAALAQRTLTVRRDGKEIDGQIQLESDETAWRFTPAARWRPGHYQLHVDGVIEDLAGNRLGKVFDVDLKDPAEARDALPSADVAFEVK